MLMSHPVTSEYAGASGTVPLGILLTQMLKDENTNFVIDDTLIQTILSRVGEYSGSTAPYTDNISQVASDGAANAAPAGIMSKILSSKGVVAACVATLMIVVTVVGVIFGSNQRQQSEEYIPEPVSIIFSGGIERDGIVHINPMQVEILSNNMSVQSWQIVTNGGTPIHQGEGNTADYGLEMLRAGELFGEFVLYVWVESQINAELRHRAGRNFYITG